MRQDLPDLENLLLTVRDALDGFAGKLEGESRYHAQVASYLLSMAAREVAAERSERPQGNGEIARLCHEIRAGGHDGDWEKTLNLVLQQVIDKVKVTRPDHLAPMHRPKESAS